MSSTAIGLSDPLRVDNVIENIDESSGMLCIWYSAIGLAQWERRSDASPSSPPLPIDPKTTFLVPKLVLVAASMWGASLLARRYGHAVSSALAGLPLIVGPIMAVLLIDMPAERVRAIAVATLTSEPAMLVHIAVFANAARRSRWPTCLALATVTFLAAATALALLALGAFVASALALGALVLAARSLPAFGSAVDVPVPVPSSELAWRTGVALVIAGSVMWGADRLPAAVAGALLALPITGSVLPCFTLPRHGTQATARLLAGFVRGQSGFVAFFVVLVCLLPHAPKLVAFVGAVGSAVAAPLVLHLWMTAMPIRGAVE